MKVKYTGYRQDMHEGAYPKKKKKSVAGQFAAVRYRTETYYWTQKLNREDYGVDNYWVLVYPAIFPVFF